MNDLRCWKAFYSHPLASRNNSNVINHSFNSFFAHLCLHFNLWLVLSHDRWLSSDCLCLVQRTPRSLFAVVVVSCFVSAVTFSLSPFRFQMSSQIICVRVYECVWVLRVRVQMLEILVVGCQNDVIVVSWCVGCISKAMRRFCLSHFLRQNHNQCMHHNITASHTCDIVV